MDEIQLLSRKVKRLQVAVVLLLAFFTLLAIFFILTRTSKTAAANPPPPQTQQQVATQETPPFRVFDAPEKLDFCGEPVPLHEFEVRERYDYELLITLYKNAATILGYKRSARWFPVIEPILEANKIPEDFKYLSVIESNLANVISPSDAVGFWQFLDGTAKQYGLEVNEYVDERYDVAKATEAACKYLNEAHKKFGSWTLAAASYNMGMGGLSGEIEEQGETNYYNLKLNSETSRYILRLVVTKEIFESPAAYGYVLGPFQYYPEIPTRTVDVNGSIESLVEFARQNGTNYKLLRELNPWLRKDKLPNPKGKTYKIKLPAEGYDNYDKLVASQFGSD
jgi:hypothetical protein